MRLSFTHFQGGGMKALTIPPSQKQGGYIPPIPPPQRIDTHGNMYYIPTFFKACTVTCQLNVMINPGSFNPQTCF